MALHSPAEGAVGLPESVIEELLSDPRRRELLWRLAGSPDGMAVGDLARALADEEGRASASAPADYRRVRWDLYECHLPKLTATGVVTYDSLRERVHLTRPAIVERIDGEVGDGGASKGG